MSQTSENDTAPARHTYRLEMQGPRGEWFTPAGLGDETRGFVLGYLIGRGDAPPPRLAMRAVRSDGQVIEERAAETEVSIGQIAGWPTPEQYETAAKRAMATAAQIRQIKSARPTDQTATKESENE